MVQLSRGHDDGGVAGLQQRLGAPQQESVVRIHLGLGTALGGSGLLVFVVAAVLVVIGVLVEVPLLGQVLQGVTQVGVDELGPGISLGQNCCQLSDQIIDWVTKC